MSDLTRFRDHCRAMANPKKPTKFGGWCSHVGGIPPDHPRCSLDICECPCHPRNAPPQPSELALWTDLADEIDAYLAAPPEGVDLFGDETAEPSMEDA